VNLSGKQLEHEGIAEEVASVLHETALAPEQLVLEITETVIMQNAESTLARLRELKHLGVGLAIDDFGTGYSSLSYLQRFPVDIVKIDRVFVEGLLHGDEGIALIRTILALAEMLKLRTIAEGVEDAGQAKQLQTLGCDAGQGYLFGRPLEATELEGLLTSSAQPRAKGKRSVVAR
jgi:Amt family ammonium transporter